MTLTLTDVPPVYTVDTTVAFQARHQGASVKCEISDLALQDHFGAASLDAVSLLSALRKWQGED